MSRVTPLDVAAQTAAQSEVAYSAVSSKLANDLLNRSLFKPLHCTGTSSSVVVQNLDAILQRQFVCILDLKTKMRFTLPPVFSLGIIVSNLAAL